jgi:dTDP-4-dehydrorhamnose 3,5-epimerase
MTIQIIKSSLKNVFEIRPIIQKDIRGNFVKFFRSSTFIEHGLSANFTEDFYSTSKAGVIRGLHFQLPPLNGAKLVFCVAGNVMDVALDLRKDSPTFGCHQVFDLSEDLCSGVYIPIGVAHGFYVKSKFATILYKVGAEYSLEHDSGILWSSAGIEWPTEDPIISTRDRGLVRLENFSSPF